MRVLRGPRAGVKMIMLRLWRGRGPSSVAVCPMAAPRNVVP